MTAEERLMEIVKVYTKYDIMARVVMVPRIKPPERDNLISGELSLNWHELGIINTEELLEGVKIVTYGEEG